MSVEIIYQEIKKIQLQIMLEAGFIAIGNTRFFGKWPILAWNNRLFECVLC
jgi:hypothetical protein